MYCNAIAPANAALLGSCNSTLIGDTSSCTLSCNPPTVRVAGSSSLTVSYRCGYRVLLHEYPSPYRHGHFRELLCLCFNGFMLCDCRDGLLNFIYRYCTSILPHLSNVSLLVYSQCNVGQWSDAPAVCETPCSEMTLPENADVCVKQLMQETFTGANASLSKWFIAPQVPASVASQFWTIVNSTY